MNPTGIQGATLDYHCQPWGITLSAANTVTHLAGKKHRAQCAAGLSIKARVPAVGWAPPVTGSGWRDRIKSQPECWLALCEPPTPGESVKRSQAAGHGGNASITGTSRDISGDGTAVNKKGEGSESEEKRIGEPKAGVSRSKICSASLTDSRSALP